VVNLTDTTGTNMEHSKHRAAPLTAACADRQDLLATKQAILAVVQVLPAEEESGYSYFGYSYRYDGNIAIGGDLL